MTQAAARKLRRAWGTAGFAAVSLLLAAGCTSSAPPPGQQAAQNTRIAVAREYWRVLGVIAPEIFPGTGGGGRFTACQPASGAATQIAYSVANGLLSENGNLAPGPFTAKLEQLLQAHGWSAFRAQNGAMVSTNGGYRVALQPASGKVGSLSATLTVSGPCVDVGAAYASAAPTMKLDDAYPNAEVSASPTPTSPLPAP